jgi:hypothetical protein
VWGWVSWSWGWLVLVFFMSVSIDKLNTDLLGEGQLNGLAGGLAQSIGTFVNSDGGFFDFWDLDAFLFAEIFTGYSWEVDWFVNTDLLWCWVGNLDIDIDGWDCWYVVLGSLGNFVAVLVSVSTMSVSTMSITTISWLADSYHLGVGFLDEDNFDGLGITVVSFGYEGLF